MTRSITLGTGHLLQDGRLGNSRLRLEGVYNAQKDPAHLWSGVDHAVLPDFAGRGSMPVTFVTGSLPHFARYFSGV